jgi:hypothetical protein
MCPACLTTAALLAAGTTSAGGVTALVLRKFLRRKPQPKDDARIGHTRPPAN